ncbi:MAG: aminoacyl-tRNA hydrolase [Acidithiobacillus sp.]|nr:aminoacyl-tRNA hydrolase [Acidithiobacillus sp.]
MDWLIAGLGNPGPEYAKTRHNAGFCFVQRLADQGGARWHLEKSWHLLAARMRQGPHDLLLVMPQDYMNRSGGPVQAALAYYQLPPSKLLVVHDDLDLPVGVARLKWSGGHGGHNGLRDLDRALGTRDYWRLRLGIGHPGRKEEVVGYVLARHTSSEQAAMAQAMENSQKVLDDFLQGRVEAAMQTLHST